MLQSLSQRCTALGGACWIRNLRQCRWPWWAAWWMGVHHDSFLVTADRCGWLPLRRRRYRHMQGHLRG